MTYEKNRHSKSSTTITFNRFRINGNPTCLSWCGSKKHKPEVCEFLLMKNFGTVPVCAFSSKPLKQDKKNVIIPSKNCPLWKPNQSEDFGDPSVGKCPHCGRMTVAYNKRKLNLCQYCGMNL